VRDRAGAAGGVEHGLLVGSVLEREQLALCVVPENLDALEGGPVGAGPADADAELRFPRARSSATGPEATRRPRFTMATASHNRSTNSS